MSEVNIGPVSAFSDPGRRVIDVAGVEIGVFLLDGQFYAYENYCPHLGGPACQGKILPLALEDVRDDGSSGGRVFSKDQTNVICPWHGFEFNIKTGEHPIKKRLRLRKIKVRAEDGYVYVTPPERPLLEPSVIDAVIDGSASID